MPTPMDVMGGQPSFMFSDIPSMFMILFCVVLLIVGPILKLFHLFCFAFFTEVEES